MKYEYLEQESSLRKQQKIRIKGKHQKQMSGSFQRAMMSSRSYEESSREDLVGKIIICPVISIPRHIAREKSRNYCESTRFAESRKSKLDQSAHEMTSRAWVLPADFTYIISVFCNSLFITIVMYNHKNKYFTQRRYFTQ